MTGKPVEVRERSLREREEPREEERELEEEVAERRQTASAELAKALSRVIGESGKITIKIERLTTSLPAMEKALSPRRATDPREIAESDAGKSVKDANDKAVEDTLDEAAKDDDTEAGTDGKKEEEKKEGNLKAYLAGFLALLVGGAAELKQLFEALVRGANGDKIDDLITSSAQQEALLNLVEKLADEPDEKYWADFADFVKHNASLAEIVFFLQYTMLLNPLGKNETFAWKSWSDENEQVETLIAVYKKSAASGKTDVIKALPKVEYQDAEVPRYIQASLGQLAFARVLQDRKA